MEGCKFIDFTAGPQNSVKIELPADNLEILKISSKEYEQIILVKNVKRLDLPQKTLDAIKAYKDSDAAKANQPPHEPF